MLEKKRTWVHLYLHQTLGLRQILTTTPKPKPKILFVDLGGPPSTPYQDMMNRILQALHLHPSQIHQAWVTPEGAGLPPEAPNPLQKTTR